MSATGRGLVLATAFLSWFFAGPMFAISSLVMRDAARDLLGSSNEALVGQWFGWLIGAFLCGAATGGYLFGWVGDRFGRAKALGASIVCYATLSGACYFVQAPWQLLIAWYLANLGVGGVWPNAIALVSEAWPNVSRPLLAGVIGTSTNIGILLFASMCTIVPITPESWRWVFMVSAAPIPLGVFVLAVVPESPRWLALRSGRATAGSVSIEHVDSPVAGGRVLRMTDVFRPPILRTTLIGIALGAVPLFGGWGSSNWANAWASQIGERTAATSGAKKPDPGLKARVLMSRSLPGAISSLLGGGLAVLLGRKCCYFLLSLAALCCAQYLFWFLKPDDPRFLWWNGALGLCSGFYFGWLPLCLPEFFPTRVRSMGAGVSYNFGRLVTAFGVLVAADLLKRLFQGDYAQIGRVTSLVYALGMVVIIFAPKTATDLED